MFTRFDANKSTKGASKLRRDLINAEIANLRDLLPLPPSTRQRLSQLQLMALVCVYVRKANYFQQAFKRHDITLHQVPTPNIGFSKALTGFLMMMTQNGKLLYISDNAAEYLGHSMEDLLIHGDSVYDIIDKQDHQAIQAELGRTSADLSSSSGLACSGGTSTSNVSTQAIKEPSGPETRMFLCRMNVSRNARRQMRFGDQKVVLVQGHYLSYLPLCSRNEPVFLATCTPIAMPETRECVVQGATNVFTSVHSMDMKYVHIDKNGEFHLGYSRSEIQNASWYKLLHWDSTREAQTKHKLITQSEQDRSCILLVRLQRRNGDWLWVHCVLQVKENIDNNQQPVILCTNQILSDREASVLRSNGWLYHYYMVQSKLQYGLTSFDSQSTSRIVTYYHGDNQNPIGSSISSFGPSSESSATGIGIGHHESTNHYHHIQQQGLYIHNTSSHGGGHYHHHGQHVNGVSGGSTHQRIPLNCPRMDTEPVDYSVHGNDNQHNHHLEVRSTQGTGYNVDLQQIRSSPVPVTRFGKRKSKLSHNLSTLDLEPLKVIPSPRSSPGPEVIMDLDRVPCGNNSILLMSSISLPALSLQHSRPRIMAKSTTTVSNNLDSAEFIEQWNPSPPWSDTVQKVPDISHQDLSPYVTTTPPTPTGTPGVLHSTHSAFTFDWMPEQYVPNMSTTTISSTKPVPVLDDHNFHTTDSNHSHHHHHPLEHYRHHLEHLYQYSYQTSNTSANSTWSNSSEEQVIHHLQSSSQVRPESQTVVDTSLPRSSSRDSI